ncbi:hypothetical protein HanRHA438_Chr09g0403461 [Helianthus annuus]|nr:hypothetical protein HanRHA438_Chr09g0403461 [Helianthus annuus]
MDDIPPLFLPIDISEDDDSSSSDSSLIFFSKILLTKPPNWKTQILLEKGNLSVEIERNVTKTL